MGRIAKLEGMTEGLVGESDDLRELLERRAADPVDIVRPLVCPSCAGQSLIRVVALVEVEADAPEVERVVGGGFSCPKCKRAFYADGTRRWFSDEAERAAQAEPAAKVEDKRARVRSRNGGGF